LLTQLDKALTGLGGLLLEVDETGQILTYERVHGCVVLSCVAANPAQHFFIDG